MRIRGRPLRKRAHKRRPHIEHVIGIRGAVSDAASDIGALLDQRDGYAAIRLAQQVTRQEDTAGATADDKDMPFAARCHSAPILSADAPQPRYPRASRDVDAT